MRIHESESKGAKCQQKTEEKNTFYSHAPNLNCLKKGDNKISQSLNGLLSLSTEISENKKENKIVISAL